MGEEPISDTIMVLELCGLSLVPGGVLYLHLQRLRVGFGTSRESEEGNLVSQVQQCTHGSLGLLAH